MRIVPRNKNRRQKFKRLGKTTKNPSPDENPTATGTSLRDIEFVSYSHFEELKPIKNSNLNLNPHPGEFSHLQETPKPKRKPETEREAGRKIHVDLQSQDGKNPEVQTEAKTSKSSNKETKVSKNNSHGTENEKEQENNLKLTFGDMKYNLWSLKFLSVVRIAPTDFDIKSGLSHVNWNKTKGLKWLDNFLFGLWQLYAILRILHLIFVTIPCISHFGESGSSLEILRNFSTTFLTGVFIGLYFGYIQIAAFDIPSLNSTSNSMIPSLQKRPKETRNPNLNGNLGTNPKTTNRFRIGNWVKLILRRPFRVSLLVYLPFFIYSFIILFSGLLILDPKSPIFWTSFCLESNSSFNGIQIHIGNLRFLICPILIILDTLFYFFMISLIYIAVSCMLIFFVVVEQQIEHGIQIAGSKSRDGLEKAGKCLQVIKLQALLCNRVFANVVYLTKLIALAATILGGFLAIKFFPSEPVMVLGGLFLHLEGTLIYFILFDKVQMLTDKVEELKQKIVERAKHPKQNAKVGKEYKRICRSVQTLQLQVSGFYEMERETTLNFMDYAIGQIVSLILMFP